MRTRQIARRLGAVSVAVLIVVGCSADDDTVSSTDPADATIATIATTVVPTTAPATAPASTGPPATPGPTAAPTAPPTAVPDPAALLGAALSALGSTYGFSGTITLNGATAATAAGDHVGTGSRFDVTSNETTVSYVVVPEGTWVRQGDGEWEPLQDPPATVDPIDALAAPLGVTLVSGDAQAAQLDVSVAATALGISGDAAVVVRASVQSGALTSVAYESAQNGATAQIVTTFGPAADASPVVAPV